MHFLSKLIFTSLVPLVVAVGIYVIIDPFKILNSEELQRAYVMSGRYNKLAINKGMLSLMALDSRIASHDVPDSFIFGASISCYYEVDYWKRLIDTDVVPFHFDSSSEGVKSLRLKLEFLQDTGVDVSNALIIIDPKIIEAPLVGDDILSADHPVLCGLWYWPQWHMRYLKAFYDPAFLESYLPSRFTGYNHKYGKREIFERQPMEYDYYKNEESIPLWDAEIKGSTAAFYVSRDFPACRELHCSNESRIDQERESEYRKIAQLLGQTDYHVVISPMLDLDTLSWRDDCLLREIFGAERYHNFSVEMAHVALCDSNWYDRRHYRAPVAREIMDRVYRRD